MARKSKNNPSMAVGSPSGPRSLNIRIEEAENGYTVHCSGSGKNGEYHSKNYVAPNEGSAIRLATQGLSSGLGKKSKDKMKKKSKGKIAISKRS